MKHLVIKLATNKEHPALQFIKYGVCGIMATVVDMAIFYVLALFVFPALSDSDPVAKMLGGIARTAVDLAQMERNFVLNSAIAFVGSNLTAYVLNAWLVFHSDKGSRHKELVLFFMVSGISIVIGIFLGWLLIRITGEASFGYAMKVLASLLVNYVGRKFFVFKYAKRFKEVSDGI